MEAPPVLAAWSCENMLLLAVVGLVVGHDCWRCWEDTLLVVDPRGTFSWEEKLLPVVACGWYCWVDTLLVALGLVVEPDCWPRWAETLLSVVCGMSWQAVPLLVVVAREAGWEETLPAVLALPVVVRDWCCCDEDVPVRVPDCGVVREDVPLIVVEDGWLCREARLVVVPWSEANGADEPCVVVCCWFREEVARWVEIAWWMAACCWYCWCSAIW